MSITSPFMQPSPNGTPRCAALTRSAQHRDRARTRPCRYCRAHFGERPGAGVDAEGGDGVRTGIGHVGEAPGRVYRYRPRACPRHYCRAHLGEHPGARVDAESGDVVGVAISGVLTWE
jgi:hypothetical protein